MLPKADPTPDTSLDRLRKSFALPRNCMIPLPRIRLTRRTFFVERFIGMLCRVYILLQNLNEKIFIVFLKVF